MILEIIKRGKKYRVSGYFQGKRIRASLGTANVSNADVWKEKIKRALESGSDSPLWPELQRFASTADFSHARQVRWVRRKNGAHSSLVD